LLTGVFRCLTNALARNEHRPTVRDLQPIYRDVRKTAETLRREMVASTLYYTRPFLDLVIAANLSARYRIAPLGALDQ
jgi:hypothetical protein